MVLRVGVCEYVERLSHLMIIEMRARLPLATSFLFLRLGQFFLKNEDCNVVFLAKMAAQRTWVWVPIVRNVVLVIDWIWVLRIKGTQSSSPCLASICRHFSGRWVTKRKSWHKLRSGRSMCWWWSDAERRNREAVTQRWNWARTTTGKRSLKCNRAYDVGFTHKAYESLNLVQMRRNK